MSTLWEMAATVRAEEPAGSESQAFEARHTQPAIVDLVVPGRMEYWCKLLGTTPLRLYCAVDEVGGDPTAVRRYLLRDRPWALRNFTRAAAEPQV